MAARLVMPGDEGAGSGVILNTSSSSGVLYDREMIAYTTTKHAVIAMTRQMAGDYARFGIRVNALCPAGSTRPSTNPSSRQMGGRAGDRGLYREQGAAGPLGERREIAECILFLVSDRSSYMTGQILVVDGGETVV